MAVSATSQAGPLIREWRRRRSLSQLELASRSAVSGRHLSFIETGRARPSREMILHLSQRLDVPLRERNRMLLAAGYAPAFGEHSLEAAGMEPIRDALDRFLRAHEPYPALVVDRHWDIVAANRGVTLLTEGVAPELLEPPANALRVTLHPDGMAARILNFGEWSSHILESLQRQVETTADEGLAALYAELAGYPGVETEAAEDEGRAGRDILLPLRLRSGGDVLELFSTVTTFGTPLDVTLAELAVEAFYPADERTAAALARLG
jgi:transcriptional regulator with XRE-family HTH domain